MPVAKVLAAARLRAEREARGWSRETLARRLSAVADEPLPAVRSLAHMIKEWEAGKHGVSRRYRALYAAVFEADEEFLFGAAPRSTPWRALGIDLDGRFTPDDEDRLVAAVHRPVRVDPHVVGSLAAILAEQRRLDDAIGSAPVLQAVRAQMSIVQHLAAEVRGSVRPALVDVAAQWAQFSGWLNIAIGDAPAARASLDRAAEHAEEIGDTDMVGTVLSWKGYLAERLGHVGSMIGLSKAARRGRRGPGRAYDMFQEARGHALAGDAEEAVQLLGAAREAAAAADQADAREWEYYYLEPGFFDLETGLTHLYLGRDDPRHNARAVEIFTAGLEALPAGMRRSEWAGEYISHLAAAYTQAGDAEAACAAVVEAAEVARATSSVSLPGRLGDVHATMRAKWPRDPAVVDLLDVLP